MVEKVNSISQTWLVPNHSSGIRADQYLVERIKRISRTKAQSIIKSGDFKLKTGLLKPSQKLYGGEEVELWRLPPDEPASNKNDLKIIHEDTNLLVLNKPSNLAMHPSARYLYETLTHWLREHYPNDPPRPCHRLDRETSGVVVCAKNKETDRTIKMLFMHGQVTKSYLAIVSGKMDAAATISHPLLLQGDAGLVRIRMISNAAGLFSETEVSPVSYDAEANRTLVKCLPKTGRQHQIRAHLALHGFPIVGDKLYGMGDEFFDAYTQGTADESLLEHHRHALHAHSISFEMLTKRLTFLAEIPNDLSLLGNWNF